jgi:hypothetical protein
MATVIRDFVSCVVMLFGVLVGKWLYPATHAACAAHPRPLICTCRERGKSFHAEAHLVASSTLASSTLIADSFTACEDWGKGLFWRF